jgi:hypothetical protein
MNKATFYGRIIEVSEPRVFTKDREEYSYRTVVFNIADQESGYHAVPGNYIAANDWEARPLPSIGELTKFSVRIASERNKKMPEVFFHKVNLQSVESL